MPTDALSKCFGEENCRLLLDGRQVRRGYLVVLFVWLNFYDQELVENLLAAC